MQTFTGWEYLLIDLANHWGLDKETFETRIQWAEENLATWPNELELLAEDRGHWKEYPLYMKTCMAIRAAQRGEETGHMVAFDAVCSGLQLMSVLTGCKAGALVTGLVDPDIRADAYTELTNLMSQELGYDFSAERARVKQACMTSLYGSKKEPIAAFGEDTPELQAFYVAMGKMAPGPCELLSALLLSWQPDALAHEWTLPDGFQAKVKTMVEKKARLEVSEIGSSFTYIWHDNQPVERDVKNAANIIHSIDAYVLRSLVRRCSHDPLLIENLSESIELELLERLEGDNKKPEYALSEELAECIELYEQTRMVDSVILDYLGLDELRHLSVQHLRALSRLCTQMLEYEPFDIITIHDDFKCHPNHMNGLRAHYKNILADLADADYLSFVFSQLHGRPGVYNKRSNDLGNIIRQKANYALT